MAPSEAERHDLYNALCETIGPQHAGTLMSYLPDRNLTASIDSLRTDMDAGFKAVAAEFKAVRTEMTDEFRSLRTDMDAGFEAVTAEFKAVRSEMADGLMAVHGRIDRVFLAMVGGLFTIVAALAAIVVALIQI